jgi:hypothetical protein
MRHGDAIDYTRLKDETAATYDGWHAYGRSKLSNVLMTKVRMLYIYTPNTHTHTPQKPASSHSIRT